MIAARAAIIEPASNWSNSANGHLRARLGELDPDGDPDPVPPLLGAEVQLQDPSSC